MKVFGVSIFTVFLLAAAYLIGVKFSGPGSKVLSALGVSS